MEENQQTAFAEPLEKGWLPSVLKSVREDGNPWNSSAKQQPSFKQLLRRADSYQKKLKEAELILSQSIEQLREVCPHLSIAVAETDGRHGRDIRVCQHCGIQEIEWSTNFQTLTSPGGTWFGSRIDMSRDRREGQAPVLFPMEAHQAYAYRRGPHKDVSQN